MIKNYRLYDNGGKSFDRYTVVFMDCPEYQPGTFMCFGMSDNPYTGFGQHGIAVPGKHLGKRIRMEDLPEKCQEFLRLY